MIEHLCRPGLLALLGLLPVAATAAAEPAPAYAYSLRIETPTPGYRQLLTLPASVYAASRFPGPRDLAVWDADGRAVPHALCPPPDPQASAERYIPLPLYPLQTPAAPDGEQASATLSQSSDGTTVSRTVVLKPLSLEEHGQPRIGGYLLDLRELPVAASALLVDWQRADGGSELSLDLARSDDLRRWTPLGTTPLLQTQAEGRSLSARRIDLSQRQRAYLRISTAVPLSRLQLQAVLPGAEVAAPLRWFVATPGLSAAAEPPHIDYRSLPAAPVQAARLRLPAGVNALDLRLRALDAQGKPGAQLWRGLLQAGAEEPATELSWAAQPSPALRMEILRGSPGLDPAPALELGYQPARLAFAAQGRGPWRLVYGAATLPEQEKWQCAELKAAAQVATAEGEPEILAGPSALAPPAASPPKHWELWLLLVLGAAAVVGMAWQTLRERR
ncbi:MAG: DUF3999 family protein [Stagnimonas sp.]|nr:DUF3999 family protein [Stagnimonas sp.]